MFKFRSVQQRSCFVQTAVFWVWNTWEIPSTVDKREGGRDRVDPKTAPMLQCFMPTRPVENGTQGAHKIGGGAFINDKRGPAAQGSS